MHLSCQEEENERSDKWRSFIEQIATSSQASSSENKHKEILKAESNEVKEEVNPHRVSNGDDSSGSESAEVEGTNAVSISEGDASNGRKSAEGNEIIEGTIINRVNKGGGSSRRTSSGGTEIEEGTDLGRDSEGDNSSSRRSVSGSTTGNDSAKGRDSEGDDDSSSRKSVSDSPTGNDSAKELQHSEEIKTRKVQHWAEIRPSLTSIEKILSSRVKKGKNMKGENINGNDSHLPSIEESEPVEGSPDENIQEEVCTKEILDGGISGLREENNLLDQDLPEFFSPWKELESLVQGGVPKDLRGEVKLMLSN